MTWRAPLYLTLLPLVVALGAALLVLLRGRAAAMARFVDAGLAARLTPHLDRRPSRWRAWLRIAALLCLVVALAGPKWGFQWQEMKREGLDIIVALDTSRSMLATDVKPNRLERAKLAVLDLLPLLQGDRIGLVPFAGTAFLECPLTLDYGAFARSLRGTEVGIIPRGGTAMARAIDAALDGFEARQGKHEALILITDGEDHEGDAKAAAARAKELGVRIFTVGIGTPEGELLPLGPDGYVKDRAGQVVKSRLAEDPLKAIALATGGAYVQGLGPSLGLDQVFRDHIATMERREVASALQRRAEERFQWPLAAALLLLAVEALVPLGRAAASAGRRRGSAWRRRRGAAAVALCLPLLVGWFDPPGDSGAEGNQLYDAGKFDAAASRYGEGLVDAPASPALQFNLAAALFRQGKFDAAVAALDALAAAGDPQWLGRAAYNAGNARYELGAAAEEKEPQAALAAWQQALADFKRAMVADASDADAKYNHEFVTRRIAELEKKLEEQKKKEEQQQQQKQDQEQQDKQDTQDKQEQQDKADEQDKPEQAEQPPPPSEGEPGEEPPPPQEAGEKQQPPPQGEPQEQPAEPAAGTATEAGELGPDEQAARAILDTARGEELQPLDIERPDAAGTGEPAQDW